MDVDSGNGGCLPWYAHRRASVLAEPRTRVYTRVEGVPGDVPACVPGATGAEICKKSIWSRPSRRGYLGKKGCRTSVYLNACLSLGRPEKGCRRAKEV